MMDNMPVIFPGTLIGDDHPVLKVLGEASRPLTHHPPGHIGLFKLIVGFVGDYRNAVGFIQLPAKIGGNEAVRFFRFLGGEFGDFVTPLVEIDIEMGGLNKIPIEVFVLNFVPAECLSIRGGSLEQTGKYQRSR